MGARARQQPRASAPRKARNARNANNQGASDKAANAVAGHGIQRTSSKTTFSIAQGLCTRVSKKPSALPAASSGSLPQLPPGLSLPNKLPTHSRKKDRSDAYRECVICAEKKPLGHNGANFQIFPRCLHKPLTCSDCVSKHTIITLKTKAPVNYSGAADTGVIDWSICTCPQCNITLTEPEIRAVLNRKENAVITGIAARKKLESHPRWTWCLSVSCSSGQIFPEGSESQQVKCVKCGGSSCFLHGIPWHHEYTCGQYDDKHPNAQSVRSSEDRIKRMTKKCPNPQCGWRIQKSGGCQNMYCTKCHQSFYWGSAKWDDDIIPEP
ncbi:hypothetical protein AJ78_07303 [Emergomyces pasteurianus Ep9510]|uniref:RBR-type E3 ubiquitin transferase n=1 Tax=Emergomyces pasteurianus Ep9510 TaxID=1447872 RepID=A0A1J9Q760_9EURO|nr:hypothetical protein AJ78_07303 [Emergomyces pasteurianus Ep9510]